MGISVDEQDDDGHSDYRVLEVKKLMITDEATAIGTTSSGHYFARHFFEMLIAMLVGMAVLGLLFSGVLRLVGHDNVLHYAALRALFMATNMSIGMGVWMRRRGHSWAPIAEMSAAMYVPFLVLLTPFWAGLVSAGVLLVGGHLLMLPAMLGVMLYRREEYSQDHRRHSTAALSH